MYYFFYLDVVEEYLLICQLIILNENFSLITLIRFSSYPYFLLITSLKSKNFFQKSISGSTQINYLSLILYNFKLKLSKSIFFLTLSKVLKKYMKPL